jgi:sec-independent protein translocase protein TatA
MFEGAMQPLHWVVVLAIVMVLFGGKKLPELGKGLGQAIRGFKEAMREESATAESPKKSEPSVKS